MLPEYFIDKQILSACCSTDTVKVPVIIALGCGIQRGRIAHFLGQAGLDTKIQLINPGIADGKFREHA